MRATVASCGVSRARSRSSPRAATAGGRILSGFGITKLVTECFRGNVSREDAALYDTMKAIRDRLNLDLVVKHPVTPNDTITKGDEDPKAAIPERSTLGCDRLAGAALSSDCDRETALKCWDKVFNTELLQRALRGEHASRGDRIRFSHDRGASARDRPI